MSEPAITVIVVTYRSRATIGACLTRLADAHRQGEVECTVVDNQSDDGTADLVRREHGWVTLLESGQNLGFGRGNNLGLQHVHTPFVLFLNPDAHIDAASLRELLAHFERHPRAGIVGPAIHNTGGMHQHSDPFMTPGSVLRVALGNLVRQPARRNIVPGSEPYVTDWVCGAVYLARTSLVRELGGFDPRFFLYFEEMDLCLRAQQLGYETWAIGTVLATHYSGESARSSQRLMWEGCIAEHYFQSRFYYFCKHYGRLRATLTDLLEVAILGVKTGFRLLFRKPDLNERARLRAPILQMPPIREQPTNATGSVSVTARTS